MISEENGRDDDSQELTRRNILGAIGLSATGSFGMLSSEARAETTDALPELVEVKGEQRKKAINEAQNTDDFNLLRRYFEDTYGFAVDKSDIEVYRLVFKDRNRPPGRIVTFGLENNESNSTVREAKLGLSFSAGELFNAKAQLLREDSDGIRLNVASVSDGEINERVVKKTSESIEVEGEDVSANDVGECTACKEIVKYVCKYGCGLSATAICLAVGLVNFVVGVACSVIAEVVCKNIDLTDDCKLPAGQVCHDLGYCDTPPLQA